MTGVTGVEPNRGWGGVAAATGAAETSYSFTEQIVEGGQVVESRTSQPPASTTQMTSMDWMLSSIALDLANRGFSGLTVTLDQNGQPIAVDGQGQAISLDSLPATAQSSTSRDEGPGFFGSFFDGVGEMFSGGWDFVTSGIGSVGGLISGLFNGLSGSSMQTALSGGPQIMDMNGAVRNYVYNVHGMAAPASFNAGNPIQQALSGFGGGGGFNPGGIFNMFG